MGTVADLLAALELDRHGVVRLSRLRFAEPSHLVGVAALAQRAHLEQRAFAMEPPKNAHVARLACRMRLGKALGDLGFADPLGRVRERDLGSELLEVSALGADGSAAADLAALVAEKVRGHGDPVANALFQSTAEIGQNVEAYAGITGYVAAVTVPRNAELLVAVADAGVGLAGTLGPDGDVSDAAALQMALDGVSSRPGPGRGSGIRLTLKTVADLGGRCFLVSGGAAVTVVRGHAARPRAVRSGFAGTLFQASIPLR